LFPFFLRNVGWPDPLERHPCSVSCNTALPRNGISQPKQIAAPDVRRDNVPRLSALATPINARGSGAAVDIAASQEGDEMMGCQRR
jgi:hypothetical protein